MMAERMRVVMFSVNEQEKKMFESVLDETQGERGDSTDYQPNLDIVYVDAALTRSTVDLAAKAKAVSLSVRDQCDATILVKLHDLGVRLVANRFAGIVDEETAKQLGIEVVPIPEHCAESIAEYTVTLMLMLAHKVRTAVERVRAGHCTLVDMSGRELSERTVGVIGTGEVGARVVTWLRAFDTRVICFDVIEQRSVIDTGAVYVPLDELLRNSDVITLHCPLLPSTVHLLDATALAKCKEGVHIINVSRGALVHTAAIVEALHKGNVGAFGADIIEGDTCSFLGNSTFPRNPFFDELVSMNNVLVTIHSAQNTYTAMKNVVRHVHNSLKQFHLRIFRDELNNPTRSQLNLNLHLN